MPGIMALILLASPLRWRFLGMGSAWLTANLRSASEIAHYLLVPTDSNSKGISRRSCYASIFLAIEWGMVRLFVITSLRERLLPVDGGSQFC